MCTASRRALTAAALTGLPANAPLRSMMCRYAKPCSSKLRACAAGSVLNTVASAIAPWRSRTHWPSLRSMAGNRIIEASRLPLEEVGNQREPEPLAFLRVELAASHVVPCHERSYHTAIVGARDKRATVARHEMIRVHEIGVEALLSCRDAVEQSVGARELQRVPAHVRNLER